MCKRRFEHRIPDPPRKADNFLRGALTRIRITHTDLDYLFRALCCARAALRAPLARIQYAQLLFLLWLAISQASWQERVCPSPGCRLSDDLILAPDAGQK
jgi:hypothetical protein